MSHDAASFPRGAATSARAIIVGRRCSAQMLQNGPLAHTLGDSHALQAALVVVAPVVITGPHLRAARRLRTNSGTDSCAGSASGSHLPADRRPDDYTMDDLFGAGSIGHLYVPGSRDALNAAGLPGADGSLSGDIEDPGDVESFSVNLLAGRIYHFEVSGSGDVPLAAPRLAGVYLYAEEAVPVGAEG